MLWLEFLRWAHIIGATVLLGTGAGIAFFMVMAHRTNDARLVAHTAGVVVLADWLFTATAVVAQPITGALLALEIGWPLTEGWILLSLALYVFVGCFWLPVVVDATPHARPGPGSGHGRRAVAGAVPQSLPGVVSLRLPGVLRGVGDHLADDRAAGFVLIECR